LDLTLGIGLHLGLGLGLGLGSWCRHGIAAIVVVKPIVVEMVEHLILRDGVESPEPAVRGDTESHELLPPLIQVWMRDGGSLAVRHAATC
jgi:hypothetical protein